MKGRTWTTVAAVWILAPFGVPDRGGGAGAGGGAAGGAAAAELVGGGGAETETPRPGGTRGGVVVVEPIADESGAGDVAGIDDVGGGPDRPRERRFDGGAAGGAAAAGTRTERRLTTVLSPDDCGKVLTGNFVMSANVHCGPNSLELGNDAELDCKGFTLSGNGPSGDEDNLYANTGVWMQSNSNIRNCRIEKFDMGIVIKENTTGVDISSSTMTNNTYGIELLPQSKNVVISKTACVNNNATGIYVDDGSEVSISETTASSNKEMGIYARGSGTEVKLEKVTAANNNHDGMKLVAASASFVEVYLCGNGHTDSNGTRYSEDLQLFYSPSLTGNPFCGSCRVGFYGDDCGLCGPDECDGGRVLRSGDCGSGEELKGTLVMHHDVVCAMQYGEPGSPCSGSGLCLGQDSQLDCRHRFIRPADGAEVDFGVVMMTGSKLMSSVDGKCRIKWFKKHGISVYQGAQGVEVDNVMSYWNSGNGIWVQPNSAVNLTNSGPSNNGGYGVYVEAYGKATLGSGMWVCGNDGFGQYIDLFFSGNSLPEFLVEDEQILCGRCDDTSLEKESDDTSLDYNACGDRCGHDECS